MLFTVIVSMQMVFSRAARGLAPDFLSSHWSIRTSVRGIRKLIGQQALWTPPPPSARSLRMSVMFQWSARAESETCPKISFKNIQLASKPRHPEAPALTGAPNSPVHPQKYPEPLRTRSPSPSQLRGARRGAAGADGACTGEGEAAGPATGVHPAGRQRRAGGGRLTRFHGPEKTFNPGLIR